MLACEHEEQMPTAKTGRKRKNITFQIALCILWRKKTQLYLKLNFFLFFLKYSGNVIISITDELTMFVFFPSNASSHIFGKETLD